MMRYHWGLGVGHLYSHGDAPDAPKPQALEGNLDDCDDAQAGEFPHIVAKLSPS